MADEPRRSGRPTKGQHTHKDLEIETPAEPMKKRGAAKKGTARKAAPKQAPVEEEVEEDDEGPVRCICGADKQDDDDVVLKDWIGCEGCACWQHNVCMGVTTVKKEVDRLTYWCDVCRPENHKEYKEAEKRGEKIWLTRKEEYLASKKGKKGRGRQSNVHEDATSPQSRRTSRTSTPAPSGRQTPVPDKKETSRSGTKRKNAQSPELPESKSRRTSIASNPGTKQQKTETATDNGAADDKTKAKTIDNLQKGFRAALDDKKNEIALDATALKFAVELEKAVWMASVNKDVNYKAQISKLFLNIKSNHELAHRLVDGTLTVQKLATMSEHDMASKERLMEDQKIMERNDRQAIKLTDADQGGINSDTLMSDVTASKASRDPNHGMGARSQENTPGIDTDNPMSRRQSTQLPGFDSRKPSMVPDNFDIKAIMDNIKVPTSDRQSISLPPPVPHRNIEDADIDRLLGPNNHSDDDIYDPDELDNDGIRYPWRGTVYFSNVTNPAFPAIGKHIAGGDVEKLGNGLKWTDFLHENLTVQGRVTVESASQYLCGLRYSSTADVCVLLLEPASAAGEVEKDQYINTYRHLSEKKRYAVLSNPSRPELIRDTYLIPVDAGTGPLPEFLTNLEYNNVPLNRPEPLLIVTLVLRQGQLPDKADDQRLNKVTAHGDGPSFSPLSQQGAFQSPSYARNGAGGQNQQQGGGGNGGGGGGQQTYGYANNNSYDPNHPLLSQTNSNPANCSNVGNPPRFNSSYAAPKPSDPSYSHYMAARAELGPLAETPTGDFILTSLITQPVSPPMWETIKNVLESGGEDVCKDIAAFSRKVQDVIDQTRGRVGELEELKNGIGGLPGADNSVNSVKQQQQQQQQAGGAGSSFQTVVTGLGHAGGTASGGSAGTPTQQNDGGGGGGGVGRFIPNHMNTGIDVRVNVSFGVGGVGGPGGWGGNSGYHAPYASYGHPTYDQENR